MFWNMLMDPMQTSTTHTAQLATFGIHLPAWPEEPKGCCATGDSIQRGQAYAEGVRLWRAQLRSAAAFDGAADKRIAADMRNLCQHSLWDQGVVRYLLADLKTDNTYERIHAAAKLAIVNARTPGQRLGTAFVLAEDGLLVCALESVKQLIEAQHVSTPECLEILAITVANLSSGKLLQQEVAGGGGGHWLNVVALMSQVSTVLLTAASASSGEINDNSLIRQLDDMAALAANIRPGPEHDERAAIVEVKTRERRKQMRTQGKPLLRTLHHLACTGGTVISKCLAAMPDVALISEVNPSNRHGSTFEPTNPLLLLERSYRQLSNAEIAEGFSQQIHHAYRICARDEVDLIIRDHSHSDFCRGTEPSASCPVADYLDCDYELLSVVTVRHPLDSYLGLLANGWEKHFSPTGLDEYCRRYLAFLDRYSSLPILHYEEFCSQPEVFMKNLCDIIQVSYSKSFLSRFGNIILSGDSGRKDSRAIQARPRRDTPQGVQDDVNSSVAYDRLVSRLGYDSA